MNRPLLNILCILLTAQTMTMFTPWFEKKRVHLKPVDRVRMVTTGKKSTLPPVNNDPTLELAPYAQPNAIDALTRMLQASQTNRTPLNAPEEQLYTAQQAICIQENTIRQCLETSAICTAIFVITAVEKYKIFHNARTQLTSASPIQLPTQPHDTPPST